MKNYCRIQILDFPVFMNYLVHVELTSDMEKSLRKYKQTEKVPMDSTTRGLAVHVKDEPMSFIFIPPNSSVGTIAHECWHVVHRIMAYAGVDLENETVAYHLSYMVNKITDFKNKRSSK